MQSLEHRRRARNSINSITVIVYRISPKRTLQQTVRVTVVDRSIDKTSLFAASELFVLVRRHRHVADTALFCEEAAARTVCVLATTVGVRRAAAAVR